MTENADIRDHDHDFLEITTDSERAAGLRRWMCRHASCYAERTEPSTH
jgi:hypothetical protein